MSARAVSSVYGRIEVLALAMKGEISEETVNNSYGKLLGAFNDRSQIVALGNVEENLREASHKSIKKALNRANIDKSHRVILVDSQQKSAQGDGNGNGQEPNEWIEDPFTVTESAGGEITLVEPYFFSKPQNQQMAEQLSIGLGSLIRSTDLELEGGNMLFGDDYMLIGIDDLARNMDPEIFEKGKQDESFQKRKKEIEKKLKQLFGMGFVIWVGDMTSLDNPLKLPMNETRLQPLFHLDMFVTLGGRSTDEAHQGDEMIFVADIDLGEEVYERYVSGLDNLEPSPKLDAIKAFKKQLDNIAAHFQAFGKKSFGPCFHVNRFPIHLVLPPNLEAKKAETSVYAYNNCLVECYHGIRRIYLPKFSTCDSRPLKKLEKKLKRNLKDRGFRVTMVEASFRTLARNRGALNCITKVLQRSRP